jgi:hypothetical protein
MILMKILKTTLYVLVIAGAVGGFGWFFVSQLGAGRPADGLAGVLLTPPPGYAIAERGELAPTAAAADLESLIQGRQGGKVGLRFQRAGATVYWLADVPGDALEELASGASGTRLRTVWRGHLRERLGWARGHGDFSAPGLPTGEQTNLYH